MRTITNKAELPLPLYNACAHDGYVGGGDISVTRLIAPPRIVALRRFHEDEIVEDATSRIWSLLGKTAHKVLELSVGKDDDIVVETRLQMPFHGIPDSKGDPIKWMLSGQPDVYHKGIIYDYKVTSVWSLILSHQEWDKQVNLQAMLHRNKGDKVHQAFIVGILRDWQKRKARFEKDYPPEPIKMVGVPLWEDKEVIDYARMRVRLHQQVQFDYVRSSMDDSVLPMCTDEERWYRGAGYAVKKMDKNGKINKKADRVYATMEEAIRHTVNNVADLPKGKTFAPIEKREGEYIRCLSYCDVWAQCSFGRNLHARMEAQSLVNEKPEEEEATLI